jgi:(E)-4-hydroxy-3-methylbut-2-enyl-diphosphate synthase
LLEDGLGDTIRVSLTEDPELEIPVCKDILKRYERCFDPGGNLEGQENTNPVNKNSLVNAEVISLPYDPFHYQRRETISIDNIGGRHVPVVIADLSKLPSIRPDDLKSIGYAYDAATDKWNISDAAADYVFTAKQLIDFELPGTLKMIVSAEAWSKAADKTKYYPIFESKEFLDFLETQIERSRLQFVMVDCDSTEGRLFYDLKLRLKNAEISNTTILCLSSTNKNAMQSIRNVVVDFLKNGIKSPVVIVTDSKWQTTDEHLVHFATEAGGLLLDGFGDGICLGMTSNSYQQLTTNIAAVNASGRNYLTNTSAEQFINNTAFSILQATRTRISKTEYISCPSCGRTLFDLQETTAKIRSVTNHLKGVKIAIMGCIVNGPGEMADADFGYVGSGPGKITLYKGKDVMKRNVNSEVAVEELINLLKENDAWIAPSLDPS